MGGKSKTGAKANAAASKVAKAHKPVVRTVSKSMRKLLAKNDRSPAGTDRCGGTRSRKSPYLGVVSRSCACPVDLGAKTGGQDS